MIWGLKFDWKELKTTNMENSIKNTKRQKDRMLQDELPRMLGAQYATRKQWRNNPKKNEEMEPSKNNTQLWMKLLMEVWCYKEQYCIGTWNVRSMNQGKLEVIKQKTARVNIDNLGISELKRIGMDKFNSDDLYIYYCGQKSLRRNEVTIIVNKRVWNAVLGCSLKTTECFLFISKANHSISQ